MPQYCCIRQCRKRRQDGVSLFTFPHKREDHLKKWLQNIKAINLNFELEKSHVICSAHFQQKDFLSSGTSGILLKYGAVPSIFPVPQISIAVDNLTPNTPTTSTVQENTSMNVSATTEHRKVQKKAIMSSSTFHFKKQQLTPRKRKMQREIQMLKAQIAQRERKILLLQDLYKKLRNQAEADVRLNGQHMTSLPGSQASQIYMEHLYSLPPAQLKPQNQ